MKHKIVILAIALLLVFFTALTASEKQGSAGVNPLFSIGGGGRAVGMGGAYTALANDPSAVFYNSAALTAVPHRSLSFMHLTLPEGSYYDFAAFAYPTVGYGTFSAAAFLVTTDGIERRDQFGRKLDEFNASQQMYMLGYGKSLNRFVSLGAAVKLYGHNIDDFSAFGAGADFGLKLSLSDNVALGFNAQNLLAPEVTLDRDSDQLPTNFRAGLGVMIPFSDGRNSMSLAVDVDKTDNVDPALHIGGELAFLNSYFIRGGYDVDQVSLGAGVRFKLLTFSYAFRSDEFFDPQHRLSIDISFGGNVESILAERQRQQEENTRRFAEERRQLELSEALNLARSHYQTGDYDAAEGYYEKVVALGGPLNEADERLKEIENQRTAALTATVRSGVLAESDSLKAQELFADLSEALLIKDIETARLLLGRLQPSFGEDDRYAALNTQYDELVAGELRSLKRRARLAVADGKHAQAAIHYDQILRLNPDDRSARLSLAQTRRQIESLQLLRQGMAAYESGDTVAAELSFQQMLAIDPEDSLVLSMIDRLALQSSETTSSNFDLIRADEGVWKLYLEGIEKFRAGDYETAVARWEQVLEDYPGNSETIKNIRQAKLRLQSRETSD